MTEPTTGRSALPPPPRRAPRPPPHVETGAAAWLGLAWQTLRRLISRAPSGAAELMTLMGVVAAITAGYRHGETRVLLTIDGSYDEIATRAPTVADLLIQQAVAVGPRDLVVPPLATRLIDDTHVWIRRAKAVQVRADGTLRTLTSHGTSVEDVLAGAHLVLGPHDRVHVNGEPWPGPPTRRPLPLDRAIASIGAFALPSTLALTADEISAPNNGGEPGDGSEWTVEVFRAVPIVLVDNGVPQRLVAAGAGVADALRAAGVPLYDADLVSPSHDAPLEPEMRVIVTRATPFTLDADGDRREARALAHTIGEALELSGVTLAGRDYSIPGADQPLTAGLEIRVIRVAEDIQIEQVSIPYGTDTVPDPSMNLDSTRVDRAGSTGLKTVKTRIVYENGAEVDREVLEEIVDVAPVSEIIAYGTNVVWGTVDTSEGPRQYWRKLRVYATSYSASRAGTPKSAPWYGRTRLGWTMRKGVVSVDPNVIPMSTYMYVAGYGIGQAGDTGGGVKRYHIDLGYDDDNYESWHQYVDVYLLDPLPPDRDMTWILP